MMFARGPGRRQVTVFAALILLIVFAASPAVAYAPGSGTLYSDSFETLDEGWEMGNGFGGAPSPWSLVSDGGDKSFLADGRGQFIGAATRHWARHLLHPVTAASFSIAFEYRSELAASYWFHLEVEQRAPDLRKYRLKVDNTGVLSLWRSEAGAFVQIVSTGGVVIPANQKRWIRLAIEEDPSGHPRVRCRVWAGGAASEPSTWTLEFLDELDTIERVNSFELDTDGPVDIKTWIDDLDAWGDKGSGVASSVKTIYLMELSHLDIGFTEPPDEIEAFAKTHLDLVLENLESDPDYYWTIETGWWLDHWWRQSSPAQQQRMLGHLRGDRLTLSAGYASLHTTKAGYEEMPRSIYWSSRMGREHGFPLRIFITDDVPGTTFAVPELMARAGVEYFIGGMNTSFGGRTNVPDHGDRPFWWVGPDGSRVFSWFTFDSYAEGFQWGFSFFDTLADMYSKVAKKIPELEETGYPWPELLLLRGFDNHYQGFKARNLIDQWNATYQTPKFELISGEKFLDMMLAKYGPDAFPAYAGDYGAAWSRGEGSTAHTHARIRQAHRDARAAEAMLAAGTSLDTLGGADAQRDLMYEKMVVSDEHTGAGGWPGYFTPEEMERNNQIHLSYATDARDTAQSLLDEGVERALARLSATGDAVVVVNPTGRERDGWARIVLPTALYSSIFHVVDRKTGSELVFQRFDPAEEIMFRASGIPAFGYSVFDLIPGPPQAEPTGLLSVTSTTIENDHYLIELDSSSGALISLFDKVRAREMIDANSAYEFNELASSIHQDVTAQNPPLAEPPGSASVSIEYSGPLLASVKVTRSGSAHVETTYRLYRGDDQVEIENVLDREQMPYVPQSVGNRTYTVTLPFDIHSFQIRSETTTRFLDPANDGFVRDGLFDWHNVEHVLAFWDENAGMLHAMDATGVYHFENFSALTSPFFSNGDALLLGHLFNRVDEYEFDDGSVGPYVIEPDTSPIHVYTHHLRATLPGFDPVEVSRFGFEALSPLPCRHIERRPGDLPDISASYFRNETSGVLLYTVKPADVGMGLVLRMVELSGQSITARISSEIFALSAPERIEGDEEGGEPLTMDAGVVLVPLTAYETATVRVHASSLSAPITLTVDKNEAGGTVLLDWSGGLSPHTLRRSENVQFTAPETLVDEVDINSHADSVLADGRSLFYLVY